jgi:hypothetical protein
MGLDIYATRKLFFGLNAAYSMTTKVYTDYSDMIHFMTVTLDAGYHFLGDMEYDFRLSAGVNAGATYIFPKEAWDRAPDAETGLTGEQPNLNVRMGIFAQVEWKFLFAKATLSYVTGTDNPLEFRPAIGFKF